MTRSLKGMTWNHARGYDPLVAASAEWERRTGVTIAWEKRPLQDFESFPVEELARAYDLIVIDHPHVGQVAGENCLVPLDIPGREAEREAMERGSVGPSYPSYNWDGRQWGFPLDAAAQVQARRADVLDAPLTRWADVLDLARAGRVALALRPPHNLMCFFTLAGNLGHPCRTEGETLVDGETGAKVWDALREIHALVAPDSVGMDPIAVFERMASGDAQEVCTPLAYGYVPYALDGFRPHRLRFSDIPALGGDGPVGSALGGTGIAVSAFSGARPEAIDFAYWVASGAVQKGLYAASSGQPGHAAAWEDEAVNAPVAGFYRDTRPTLEGSWLRPRHDGYMGFQQAASERINEGLEAGEGAATLLADLDRLFRESFRAA